MGPAEHYSIRHDPDIHGLLDRLPKETAQSLTDTQLRHLKVALGSGKWRKHRVDMRGTVSVPFYPAQVYFVLLMGRNRREVSRQERNMLFGSFLLLLIAFFTICTGLGLLSLYLIKSSLGIDLFSEFSLGIWDWFK